MSLRCRAVCSAVSIWEWNRVALLLLLSSLITAYRAIERPRTVSKRLTKQRSEEKRGSSWEIKSISISIQSPSIVDFTWNKKTKKKWIGRFQVIGDKKLLLLLRMQIRDSREFDHGGANNNNNNNTAENSIVYRPGFYPTTDCDHINIANTKWINEWINK